MTVPTLVETTFPPGTPPEQAAATDTLVDLRYVHWDLRSVRLVTDGNGNRVDTQSHTAYGEEMDEGGAVPPFFTTYDREMTGLDYARARYYRSNHRRFTSPDSYRGSYRRGSPQSLNRYAYVANDPINRVDPTGSVQKEVAQKTQVDQTHCPPITGSDLLDCTQKALEKMRECAGDLLPVIIGAAIVEGLALAGCTGTGPFYPFCIGTVLL